MINKLLLTACAMAYTIGAAADKVQVSTTLPGSGTPEHLYTMCNGQGWYANGTTSPTKADDKKAEFAFYTSGVDGAYYIYCKTSAKWLSYTKAANYQNKTGFISMSDTKVEGAYFKAENYSGDFYQLQPYNTSGVEGKYLNWFQGVGQSNPENGTVTLGLWQDRGAQDAGSRWTFAETNIVKTYTLISDGMPTNAVVTINGQEFRGLNAQGSHTITSAPLTADKVKVACGGGSVYMVTVDNANNQVHVQFKQLFTTTTAPGAEKTYTYMAKMPAAYVQVSGDNIVHTTKKADAARLIFIEDGDGTGKYFIYDTKSGNYIYHTSTAAGNSVKSNDQSNVKLTTDKQTANTWQLKLRGDGQTVSIIPGSVADIKDGTPGWNFTGGIAQGCVLNLWSAADANSAWEIIDPSVGSMACATTLYALPGSEFMHKLVSNEGETVQGVDFGTISTLQLKTDREAVGNQYKYVYGTAPEQEGEYTYTVQLATGDGETNNATVKLTVTNFMQSPTPMMGWLTWNWFSRDISHDKLVNIARGMEKHGLIDAGFNTIVLDDCWATQQRDKAQLTWDPVKFPQGISGFIAACREVNPKVKVGIYGDAGSMTCEGYQPGSYQYEAQHMALFDSWGVDMLKYDYCNSEASTKVSYNAMGAEVAKVNAERKAKGGTPFVYNICEWGKTQPWTWGAEAGGSSWRATSDARESWIGNTNFPGVLGGVDEVRDLWMYAGVNRFNDLDMMCIGLHGLGGPSNHTADHRQNGGKITGLTDEQAHSQMSLWSMLASPLALTCDLREQPAGEANKVELPSPLITAADIATLTNTDIIAINQDALGQQAEYMEALSTGTADYSASGYDVYVKDLTGGRKAVAVCNRGAAIGSVKLTLSDLYLDAAQQYNCKDLWKGTATAISGTLETGAFKAYETKVFLLEATTETGVATAKAEAKTDTYTVSGIKVKDLQKGQVYVSGRGKILY